MKVFVTGATGFIGSAVVQELMSNGHEVLGLTRSDASAKSLAAAGATVHRGSLEDLDSLHRAAAASEGVIHTAFLHAFSDARLSTRVHALLGGISTGMVSSVMGMMGETDKRAIETMGSALSKSGHPLVIASGTMLLPMGRLTCETDLPALHTPAAYRIRSEDVTMALSARGVRASVVRLPPTVHGDGDKGFIPRLISIARKKNLSAYVGGGQNRWPSVHRLDAACLFRLALEKGASGARYHGVAEESVPFRDIAETIGRQLRVPVVAKVAGHFGLLGAIVAADNPTSSALTQQALGWRPTRASLLADLARPGYFAA